MDNLNFDVTDLREDILISFFLQKRKGRLFSYYYNLLINHLNVVRLRMQINSLQRVTGILFLYNLHSLIKNITSREFPVKSVSLSLSQGKQVGERLLSHIIKFLCLKSYAKNCRLFVWGLITGQFQW